MRRVLVALIALGLSSAAALADWRDEVKTLKVGFIAGDNPTQEVARLEKFCWRLQTALAVPVTLFPARSYQAASSMRSSPRSPMSRSTRPATAPSRSYSRSPPTGRAASAP